VGSDRMAGGFVPGRGTPHLGPRQIALLFFLSALLIFPQVLDKPGGKQNVVLRPARSVVDVSLRQGESFLAALRRFGIDMPTAHAMGKALRPFVDPRAMRAGQKFKVILDPHGDSVQGLEVTLRRAVLKMESSPQGWSAALQELASAREIRVVRGLLIKNLYQDGRRAGLAPGQILELSDIFQYEVDFFSDFRRGDAFSAAFEEIRYADGRREAGPILAAKLTLSGEPLHAFYHVNQHGEKAYYDGSGRSLRRAFLRSPLQYRRISSYFSLRRYHPILRTVRPHEAIDYAADAGTPVVSIGKGKISFTGWREGYGNLVEVVHSNGYTTRYAHFSRIASGIRIGASVAQGQIVGYVGSTGHATGPHLHFEILRGKKKINFLSLRIPSQGHLTGKELERFSVLREEQLALLNADELNLARSES